MTESDRMLRILKRVSDGSALADLEQFVEHAGDLNAVRDIIDYDGDRVFSALWAAAILINSYQAVGMVTEGATPGSISADVAADGVGNHPIFDQLPSNDPRKEGGER